MALSYFSLTCCNVALKNLSKMYVALTPQDSFVVTETTHIRFANLITFLELRSQYRCHLFDDYRSQIICKLIVTSYLILLYDLLT